MEGRVLGMKGFFTSYIYIRMIEVFIYLVVLCVRRCNFYLVCMILFNF